MALSAEDKLARIQERVRKLMNIANGSPYEEESRLAREQAEKLMAKYALNFDEITEETLRLDKTMPFAEKIFIYNPYAKRLGYLLTSVYKAFGCRVVQLSGDVSDIDEDGDVRSGQRYYTAGYKEPMSMAWLAFELLQTQLLGEMYSTKMSQGERINFILTYANVVGNRLAQRYGEEKQEFMASHKDAVGDSLVLFMKDRQDRLNQFIDDEIGPTKSVKDTYKSYWSSEGRRCRLPRQHRSWRPAGFRPWSCFHRGIVCDRKNITPSAPLTIR